MTDIAITRAGLDQLETIQDLAMTTFRETFGHDNTEEQLQEFFDEAYTLEVLGQGQGLGKRLFTFALERANQLGCTWSWLGVWEHNSKAQALYKKYGFEKFSEHQFAVGDKVDTDWLMRKYLK